MLENTNYIALSQQMALRRRLDIVANNLANMNSTAYRNQRLLFEEYLVPTAPQQRPLSFVQDVAVVRDLRPGELQPTGRPFDVAISGKGYFVIETPDGERYTRNGQFQTDADGMLVTGEGRPVLDANGQPLFLDPGDSPIVIAEDGTVSGRLGPIGSLALVEFEDETALSPVGASLYETEEVPQPATGARVMQGTVETSNVEPIVEVTIMTDLLRTYQTTQRNIEREDEMRRRALRDLGRLA